MASSSQPTAQTSPTDRTGESVAPSRLNQLSLALGIASCIPAAGLLFCIPAILCGHLALSRSRGAAQPVDIRVVVGLTLGYVIAVVYAWMAIGLFVVPALSGR